MFFSTKPKYSSPCLTKKPENPILKKLETYPHIPGLPLSALLVAINFVAPNVQCLILHTAIVCRKYKKYFKKYRSLQNRPKITGNYKNIGQVGGLQSSENIRVILSADTNTSSYKRPGTPCNIFFVHISPPQIIRNEYVFPHAPPAFNNVSDHESNISEEDQNSTGDRTNLTLGLSAKQLLS